MVLNLRGIHTEDAAGGLVGHAPHHQAGVVDAVADRPLDVQPAEDRLHVHVRSLAAVHVNHPDGPAEEPAHAHVRAAPTRPDHAPAKGVGPVRHGAGPFLIPRPPERRRPDGGAPGVGEARYHAALHDCSVNSAGQVGQHVVGQRKRRDIHGHNRVAPTENVPDARRRWQHESQIPHIRRRIVLIHEGEDPYLVRGQIRQVHGVIAAQAFDFPDHGHAPLERQRVIPAVSERKGDAVRSVRAAHRAAVDHRAVPPVDNNPDLTRNRATVHNVASHADMDAVDSRAAGDPARLRHHHHTVVRKGDAPDGAVNRHRAAGQIDGARDRPAAPDVHRVVTVPHGVDVAIHHP